MRRLLFSPMLTLTLTLMLMLGCAPDLRDDFPFDGQTSMGPLVSAERTTRGTKLLVDATDKKSQVFVDLEEGREMKAEEAFSTNAWDLSVKRFEIGINSGASNPEGAVLAQVLKNQDYEALTVAPADGYAPDTEALIFNSIEGGWYFYDLGVHRLITRADLLYVVKASSGAYFKLKMLSYYDDTGTPASISLEYAPLAAP